MSKTPPLTDIGKFYKQVEDFKEKLIIIFEKSDRNDEIVEIKKYYDKLIDVKKINVRTPIELLYNKGVSVYCREIFTRNDKFFVEEASKVDTGDKKDILFISQIKLVWKDLPTSTRDAIWNYIQVICLLSEKITGGTTIKNCVEELKRAGLIK